MGLLETAGELWSWRASTDRLVGVIMPLWGRVEWWIWAS